MKHKKTVLAILIIFVLILGFKLYFNDQNEEGFVSKAPIKELQKAMDNKEPVFLEFYSDG